MFGKAVARSLRAHFLVESALMGLLTEQAPKDEFDTSSLEKMYQDLVQRNLGLDDEGSSDIVIRLTNVVEKFKSEISSASRTAKLWLQYLEYVSIIRMFIRAERTGKWHEHLEDMRLMLNLFAATGHISIMRKVLGCIFSLCSHLIENTHGFISSIVNQVTIVSDAPIATGHAFGLIW